LSKWGAHYTIVVTDMWPMWYSRHLLKSSSKKVTIEFHSNISFSDIDKYYTLQFLECIEYHTRYGWRSDMFFKTDHDAMWKRMVIKDEVEQKPLQERAMYMKCLENYLPRNLPRRHILHYLVLSSFLKGKNGL
jgi:hypothetical protein